MPQNITIADYDTTYYDKDVTSLRMDKIPRNKLVRIKTIIEDDSGKGGQLQDFLTVNNKPIPLWYDDELSLKFDSSYGSFLNGIESDSVFPILSNLTGGVIPSGKFQINGAQTWKETSPLDLSFNIKLYMEDNGGYRDVVKPTMTLIEQCLPTKSTMDVKSDEKATLTQKIGCLIPPGPSIKSAIRASSEGGGLEGVADSFMKIISKENGVSKGLFELRIGKFTFKNVMFKSVEPTFSSQVDEEGYPISVELSISVTTILIPTTDYVKSII